MSHLTHTYTTKTFAAEIYDHPFLGKKLRMLHPLHYKTEINKFRIGEKVTFVITSKKPKRTEQQNRYYWGVYLPLISSETGNDIDDLHTLFKGKFLGKEIVDVMGEKVRRVSSTTELSTSQFIEYIMRIEEFTGVLAPPTEEYVHGEKPIEKLEDNDEIE